MAMISVWDIPIGDTVDAYSCDPFNYEIKHYLLTRLGPELVMNETNHYPITPKYYDWLKYSPDKTTAIKESLPALIEHIEYLESSVKEMNNYKIGLLKQLDDLGEGD